MRQQTFVFHKPLTNEPPALAGSGARKCGAREFYSFLGKFLYHNERREKQAAALADICFSQAINERAACDSRQ